MDKNKTMIPPELKTPENLRRVVMDIPMNGCLIYKGALGYLIGRTTIHHPISIHFISLCERYQFNVTDLKDIENYLNKV